MFQQLHGHRRVVLMRLKTKFTIADMYGFRLRSSLALLLMLQLYSK
jgi:hypothetical protein